MRPFFNQSSIISVMFWFCSVNGKDIHVGYYTNSWAVQSKTDISRRTIEIISKKEGFVIQKEVDNMSGLYHFIHERHPRRSKYENEALTRNLLKYQEILWAVHVSVKKSSLKAGNCPGLYNNGVSAYSNLFIDPAFSSQWLLQDCRAQRNSPLADLNIVPVWYKYRIFGNGILAAVSDSEVEGHQEDLKDNFDESLSKNFYKCESRRAEQHGTMTSGIMAMRAGNKYCGVGIAPLVTFGSIITQQSDNSLTEIETLESFNFCTERFHVMSCAWGPNDDGKFIRPLGWFMLAAFKEGITRGRKGKGMIYVFPSGNGGYVPDNCSFDELVNSMYTIGVGGIDYNGRAAGMAEACSAILVSGYSGDQKDPDPLKITSTGIADGCLIGQFAGTSVVVPQISGVVALLLEANPNLCWRAVQHTFAWTSEVAPIAHNSGWKRNAAGFYYHQHFGFGIVNGLAAVELALFMFDFEINLPAMNTCIYKFDTKEPIEFNRKDGLNIAFAFNGCKSLPSEINYIEHVQLVITIKYKRRGNLKILLTSSAGTETLVLDSRSKDRSWKGLKKWVVDTTHLWGEKPIGLWHIRIFDSISALRHSGQVIFMYLVVHGTKLKPLHYNDRRKYYRFSESISQKTNEEFIKTTVSTKSNWFDSIKNFFNKIG